MTSVIRHRHAVLLGVLLVGLAALAVGCGGDGSASASLPNGVVVQVGNDSITQEQVDKLLSQAEKSYKANKRQFPKAGSPEYQSLQGQAIQYLVQRAEIAQKAEELGVTVSDQQVDERLKQLKKQYFGGDEKKYQQQLKQQDLTEDQLRGDIRAQLLSEVVFKKVTSVTKVTDEEIKDYYLKHPEQFSQPQTREVRHILISCPADKAKECAKAKQKADGLYRQLKNGAGFAALAKKYSQDTGSKGLGGKLTISKGQTVPEFDQVAFSLKTGEISKPVKTQYGWHIIQALGTVKPRQTTPFDKVKTSIRQQLLNQKQSEAVSKFSDDLKKEFASKTKYAKGFEPPPTQSVPTTTG